VLLVADYAETRTGLPAMLAAAAGDPGGPALRVLLLARSAGEWWQQLQDSCPDQVSDLLPDAPVTLGPVAGSTGQGEVFAEALAAFAALRGIPCPDAGLRPTDADAVVLAVHAAALLAVLDAEDAAAGGTGGAGGDVLGGLLRHERRYWQRSLAGRVAVSLDPDVTDRVVTAGCLIGAGDQGAARRLLAVIPDLGDGLLRGKVARWLHDLYPVPGTGSGEEWIGRLQPDQITERLVVSVLGRHRELIPRLFTGLDEARARRALTILARAALTQPAALDQARQALEAHPAHLLIPAVAVTTKPTPPWQQPSRPGGSAGRRRPGPGGWRPARRGRRLRVGRHRGRRAGRFIRRSTSVLPWIIEIVVGGAIGKFLWAAAAGAGDEAGRDGWKALKRLIIQLYEARKASRAPQGGVTIRDKETGTLIQLPPDLPNEAYQRLYEIETFSAPLSGLLRWDAEAEAWRDMFVGEYRCMYPGCLSDATQSRVNRPSPKVMLSRLLCDDHAAAVDDGDMTPW
jgi:hypothetical protein